MASGESQLTSQFLLAVTEKISKELRDFLESMAIKVLELRPGQAAEIDEPRYADFKQRKISDVFDVYLFGHKEVDLVDRLRAIVMSHDGRFQGVGNTLNNPVVDKVNKTGDSTNTWSFIPIDDKPIPGSRPATSELQLIEKLHREPDIVKWKRETQGWTRANGFPALDLERFGPWDPHAKRVLTLTKANFATANVKGNRVAVTAHGSANDFQGTNEALEKFAADFTVGPAEAPLIFDPATGTLRDNPDLKAGDFFNADGTPLALKELFLGSCNAYFAVVKKLQEKNAAETAAGNLKAVWRSPIAGVNGLGSYTYRSVLHFAGGATDSEKLRIASEYSALFNGMRVGLTLPAKLDINNLPAAITVTQYGSGLADLNVPTTFANQSARKYTAKWNDIYLSAPGKPSENTATLEFTGLVKVIGTAPNQGVFAQVTLEDPAHGIYEKITFWMLEESVAPGALRIVLVHFDPNGLDALFFPTRVGIQMRVGPGLRSFRDFARSWASITQRYVGTGKLTHAYWDAAHLLGYSDMATLPPAPEGAPPQRKWFKFEFKK